MYFSGTIPWVDLTPTSMFSNFIGLGVPPHLKEGISPPNEIINTKPISNVYRTAPCVVVSSTGESNTSAEDIPVFRSRLKFGIERLLSKEPNKGQFVFFL